MYLSINVAIENIITSEKTQSKNVDHRFTENSIFIYYYIEVINKVTAVVRPNRKKIMSISEKITKNRIKNTPHQTSNTIIKTELAKKVRIFLETIKTIIKMAHSEDYKRKNYSFLPHNTFSGISTTLLKYKILWGGAQTIESTRGEMKNKCGGCSVCVTWIRNELEAVLKYDHRVLETDLYIAKRGCTWLDQSFDKKKRLLDENTNQTIANHTQI